jgi:hypothetical protein
MLERRWRRQRLRQLPQRSLVCIGSTFFSCTRAQPPTLLPYYVEIYERGVHVMDSNYTAIAGARLTTEQENGDSYEAGARALACGATFLWLVLGILRVKHREIYIALLFVATAFALFYLHGKMREIRAAWNSMYLPLPSSSGAQQSELQNDEHRVATAPADSPASTPLSGGIGSADEASAMFFATLAWVLLSIFSFACTVSFVALIAFGVGNVALSAINITLAVSAVVVGYGPLRTILSELPQSASRGESFQFSVHV